MPSCGSVVFQIQVYKNTYESDRNVSREVPQSPSFRMDCRRVSDHMMKKEVSDGSEDWEGGLVRGIDTV